MTLSETVLHLQCQCFSVMYLVTQDIVSLLVVWWVPSHFLLLEEVADVAVFMNTVEVSGSRGPYKRLGCFFAEEIAFLSSSAKFC